MLSRDIRRIMRENEKYAKILEDYDRTGKFPLDKLRRSFTLKRMTVDRLKKASKKTGRSMSDILDKLVDNNIKSAKSDN